MITEIIKNIKAIISITLVIAALGTIGAVLNSLIVWSWLKYFFVILRVLLDMIDFMVDTDALLILTTISLSILTTLWAFKGVMWVIKWFNQY